MRVDHVIILDSVLAGVLQRVSKLRNLCSSLKTPECDRYEQDTLQELDFQMKNHVRMDYNAKMSVDIMSRQRCQKSVSHQWLSVCLD